MIHKNIRMYNKKYRDQYGQMVICCDGPNTWRREYFPEYKASRKKSRDKTDSTMDWNEVYRILNTVRDEISANLPYKVIQIDTCEADDIIATLALQTQEFGQHEPVMIVSSDKDFIQLQRYKNVKQFSPIQKKWLRTRTHLHICGIILCVAMLETASRIYYPQMIHLLQTPNRHRSGRPELMNGLPTLII